MVTTFIDVVKRFARLIGVFLIFAGLAALFAVAPLRTLGSLFLVLVGLWMVKL